MIADSSKPLTHALAGRTASDRSCARPWLLIALGALETVLVLTRVDLKAFASSTSPVLRALEGLHVVPRVLVATAVAVVLFAGERTRADAREVLELARRRQGGWLFLAAHGIAFLTLLAALDSLFGQRGLEPVRPLAALGLIVGAGLATASTGALLGLEPRALAAFVRRQGSLLAFGVVAGAVAWALGTWSASELWDPMRRATLAFVTILLTPFEPTLVVQPADFVIGTPSFRAQVAPACSGFEGIGLVAGFLGSYLLFFRAGLRFPRALWLPVVGAIVAWLVNGARIALLIWIGTHVSERAAVEGFHSIAGTLASSGVALGTVLVTRRWVSREPAAGRGFRLDATTVWLTPLLVLVLSGIVLGAFAGSGLDVLHPLRPALVLGAFWLLRSRLPALRPGRPLGAVALGIAGWLLWIALLRVTDGAPAALAQQEEWAALPSAWAGLWLFARIASTVVAAPLAEELAFRGYLMRRLTEAEFERVPFSRVAPFAVIASSVLFGLTHTHAVAAVGCGALFALAQVRGRSVGDAVLAHAVTNALLVTQALVTGAWSVWI